MFSQLPTEILYIIFNNLITPLDHVQFSSVSRSTWSISQHTNLRNKLLLKFFENNTLSHDIYQELCRLIESADVKPKSNQILQVLEEQIETHHFVTFNYTNTHIKAKILDLFRPKCQKINDNLMNNQPVTTMRQLTSSGPRRIYYDITIQGNLYKCVFYDLYKITAFDESYTAHEGTMQFEDEGIVSDMSWQSIFKATMDEPHHVVVPGYNTDKQDVAGCDTKPQIVPDTRYLTLNKTPRNWKPCLLHTFHDCTLLKSIKKGGLNQEEKFKYVFVYENKFDDSICIEFCTVNSLNCIVPRGYLLMKEHVIQWH